MRERTNKELIAIIDMFSDDFTVSDLERFILKNPALPEQVARFALTADEERLQICIIFYYLVYAHRCKLFEVWPFQLHEILPIFKDLGLSLFSYT